MKFVNAEAMAKKWSISPRTVRYYCELRRIPFARLIGKTWFIPENATKPERSNAISAGNNILFWLLEERKVRLQGRIYQWTQINLAYNSNRIEGSQLSVQQTTNLYTTNTLGPTSKRTNIDDIIEMRNHFACFDTILDTMSYPLDEKLIKRIHRILKSNTSQSRQEWFNVGEYKQFPNQVGNEPTTAPSLVHDAIANLLDWYNNIQQKNLEDLLEFHYRFEKIHPFQDGNGRVGRLIMFRECLKNDIVPFIIFDKIKNKYYEGLSNWQKDKNKLIDVCLICQAEYKKPLDYFDIQYKSKK